MKRLASIVLPFAFVLSVLGQGFTFRDPALVVTASAGGGGTPTGNTITNATGSPVVTANSSSPTSVTGLVNDVIIVLVGWENTGSITALTNDAAANQAFTLSSISAANGVNVMAAWVTMQSTLAGTISATVSGTCDFRDWYLLRVRSSGTITVTSPVGSTGTGTSVSVGTYNTATVNGLLAALTKVDNSSTHASEAFGGQAATEDNITGSSSSGFRYTHTAAQSSASFTETISTSLNWANRVVLISAQ